MSDPPAPGTILVAAAVVRRDGSYLLGLRPAGKRHGGRWEFPGGKLHSDETLEEGMSRELAEELNVEVHHVGRPLFEARDPGTPFLIRFVEVEVSGEPKAIEHDEVRWVPLSGLGGLPLAPSDARFVREGLGVASKG